MEVLGAVSSAVALAEIFAKSVLTTKKLWDEAQDVPEEINRLMNDLTHLKPMLEEAEAVFNNQAQNPSTDTGLLLMHNYKEVSGKLHLLAADLNQRIVTAKRGKRNLTKLKAMLSKTLIQRYQRELDSISQTLSFFFNVHNLHSQKESQALHLESISLHRNTDDKICQLLSLVQSRLLPQTVHNIQPSRLEGDPNSFDGEMVEDGVGFSNQNCLFQTERRQRTQKPKPIAWRPRRLFGGYTYQTSEHPGKQRTKVIQVRLELPWCLSGRAWDFEAHRSPMGWNMSIRPWTVRPPGDRIFSLVREGSWPEIAEQFNSGQASISDRDAYGNCLLTIALEFDRYDVARSLVHTGFEIEGSRVLQVIEHICANRPFGHSDVAIVEWFQFAAELGLLGTLTEKMCGDVDVTLACLDVWHHAWKLPEVFSLFITERTNFLGEYSILGLFRSLWWKKTDPRFFLELCRNKNISPQFDREYVMKNTSGGNMVDFAQEYFALAPGRVAPSGIPYLDSRYDGTTFQDWKELAVWVLTDIPMDELVWQPSEISQIPAASPFLEGLYSGTQDLHEGDRSPRNMRLNKRRLNQTMCSWLEDAQASGIDLAEYGRRQLDIHNSGYESFDRRSNLGMIRSGGPRLISFMFGPRPQDWKLIWDPDVEEFAGDFWDFTENPPLHIPGAYPEDDW
ncbi:hypothetical protein CGCS363_v003594 [Colletotrichum siamense]|uniref:uncharacterized protein n=1 Tax=Colletotrichum siamense TaxID=690259 RepID=UPI0018730A1A|nr:uncharacterized protein CGCS363_v003594 [Colletotrichum siamense]KAF5511598.1 hypothetical protein CGCS363_v003594 [Colletotrichum siamense]